MRHFTKNRYNKVGGGDLFPRSDVSPEQVTNVGKTNNRWLAIMNPSSSRHEWARYGYIYFGNAVIQNYLYSIKGDRGMTVNYKDTKGNLQSVTLRSEIIDLDDDTQPHWCGYTPWIDGSFNYDFEIPVQSIVSIDCGSPSISQDGYTLLLKLNEQESTCDRLRFDLDRELAYNISDMGFGPRGIDGSVSLDENPRIVIYPYFDIPELHVEGDGKEYAYPFNGKLT